MNAAEIRKAKIALYKSLRAAFVEMTNYLTDTVDDDENWEDVEPELDALRLDTHDRVEALFEELWPGKSLQDADVQRELA